MDRAKTLWIDSVLVPLAIQVTFRGVVYSFPCAECPCTYIGQTRRSLEHCRALKNGELGSSALAEHMFSLNHRVDLLKAMVVDTHNPDPLHTGVLAHPAPLVPTQRGERYLAMTLSCTTDLTVQPSGILPLLCYYYY